jgi:hypothetical protein
MRTYVLEANLKLFKTFQAVPNDISVFHWLPALCVESILLPILMPLGEAAHGVCRVRHKGGVRNAIFLHQLQGSLNGNQLRPLVAGLRPHCTVVTRWRQTRGIDTVRGCAVPPPIVAGSAVRIDFDGSVRFALHSIADYVMTKGKF